MFFKFVILVTPRIINFRLAPASASLRLTRSLRIYYSMLCGSGICLISDFFQLLAFLCTFALAESSLAPSGLWTEAIRNVLCQVYRKYYVVAMFHNYNFLLNVKKAPPHLCCHKYGGANYCSCETTNVIPL